MFSSDSQVLLADGSYKNITQIANGDSVLNMNLEPVKVTEVKKVGTSPVVEVKYQNWYAPLYCAGNLQVFAQSKIDGEMSETTWANASELTNNHYYTSERDIYKTRLSETFSVELANGKTLEASADAGLLFGLYAGYGSCSNDGKLVFRFGPNDSLVEQVQQLLKNLFDAETTTEKDEYCYKITTSDAGAAEFFTKFGSKLERTVPKEYLCSNLEFAKGLFQGLVDYEPETKISRFIPVSRGMAEVFLTVCSLLHISFMNDTPRVDKRNIQVYPLFVEDQQDDTVLGRVQSSTLIDLELEMWSLSVECPTNSVIVNNMVVKSA